MVAACAVMSDALAQSSPASARPAVARTWTTTDGHAFQATLVQVQGTQVTLRLGNGQLAGMSLSRLSEGDQLFIKGGQNPTAPGQPATAARVPPEKRIWPAKVEVDSRAIEVSLVKDDAAAKDYRYRSQNFEFISEDKLAGSVMKEIARTFEATRSLVQALPWGIDPQPPADLGYYQAKFYVTRESYIADGAPPNSGGVYFSKDRIFRIPFPSLGLQMRGKTWFKDDNYRNDTIVHEITHQMMHDFIFFLPTWVSEGTAEYTEMLPYHAGRFLSGSHERGIKDYLKEAEGRQMKPAHIGSVMEHMSMTSAEWSERSARGEQSRLYFSSLMLVYFFSHLDGDGKGTRFLRYMDKMAEARDAWAAFFKNPNVTLRPDGSFTYRSDTPLPPQKRGGDYGLEQLDVLLDGRSPDQLQKDVVDGFRKIGVRW